MLRTAESESNRTGDERLAAVSLDRRLATLALRGSLVITVCRLVARVRLGRRVRVLMRRVGMLRARDIRPLNIEVEHECSKRETYDSARHHLECSDGAHEPEVTRPRHVASGSAPPLPSTGLRP